MTSVTKFHCSTDPGKTKGRPSSLQIVAYTDSVSAMFIALSTAKPKIVCDRWTLHVNPMRSAAANSSSSCA